MSMNSGVRFGNYEIGVLVGAGGMGRVFSATDVRLGRKVALKILAAKLAGERQHRDRFLREARSASSIAHPGVCVIHEVGESADGELFIAMEFVEGSTFSSLSRDRTLSVNEVADLGAQVADALDAAHARGVVHRDIKPSNLCRTPRGLAKVLDFGLAKRLTDSKTGEDSAAPTSVQTIPGQVLGTPNYMSPEQVLGKPVDARTDIFSLGVVLYELAAGINPFAGDSLAAAFHNILNTRPEPLARFRREAPQELDRILYKCLQKDPERRYQTARDLFIDLDALRRGECAGEPAFGPAPSPTLVAANSQISRTAPLPGTGESDVIISYSQIDDQPLLGERLGWVSQFKQNLSIRLEQLAGEKVRVWPQGASAGDPVRDTQSLGRISEAKAMISILSPPFTKTETCRRHAETFYQAASQSGLWRIENRARLFKVVKTPVDEDGLPESLGGILGGLLGFEFYDVDPATGRLQEFSEGFGDVARRRFLERIYDLAHDIHAVMRGMRSVSRGGRTPAPPAVAKAVYLAETTHDLREERDQLRRELMERGFQILPEAPLPVVADEAEAAVRRAVARAEATVHLMGSRYGLIPEGADESMAELQVRVAGEGNPRLGFSRIVWVSPHARNAEPRQSAFIQRLRATTEGMEQTEMLSGGMDQVKSLLLRHLANPPPAEKPTEEKLVVRRVYLLCDPGDAEAVEPIEDTLFAYGLDVATPVFGGEAGEFQQMHIENLRQCDAVLIYFGQASVQWMEMKLLDLLKAPGYGREKPWLAQCVYIAPPEHRRKERFRSHSVDVVREMDGFRPNTLEAFIQKVKPE